MFNTFQYLSEISLIIRQNPHRADDIANSFSATQFKSKQWLVDVLSKHNNKSNPKVLILGGWYGSLLVPMLNNQLKPSKIILSDIDPDVVGVATQLHKTTQNVECLVLNGNDPIIELDIDIIINTSCEHMHAFGEISTASKCLYALQTCDNANDPGHINTSTSTEEFKQKTKLKKILFAGRQNLGHKNRFMLLGYK